MSARLTARSFRLDGVDARRLSLPLAAPLVTGRGRYLQRELVLLRVRVTVDGHASHGWGEAAPLPGWNDADLDELAITAERLRTDDDATVDTLQRDIPALQSRPALRFGLECGVLDALCRAAAVPMVVALAERRGVEPARAVPVQCTLGDCDAEHAVAALANAQQAGFTHAKLKVGARTCSEDLERIRAIAAARPEMTFRLDANGAWCTAEALDMLAALPAGRVEWIEQPVVDLELDTLLARYDGRGPAVAADESCADPQRASALVRSGRLGAIVVKPSALGGLQAAAELFETAKRAHVAVVISNLMESAVGRAAVAHLAAAWPTLPGPHGLATGAWFARDLAPEPDVIDDGRLKLRAGPGLGFEPVWD